MWEQTNGFDRTVLIAGTSYILGVIAVLIVMLTFDLPLVVFYLSRMPGFSSKEDLDTPTA